MVYNKSLVVLRKESKNMRPLGWKTLVDQLRFQYGERFDHNSEFKRPHIGNPCIKVFIQSHIKHIVQYTIQATMQIHALSAKQVSKEAPRLTCQ